MSAPQRSGFGSSRVIAFPGTSMADDRAGDTFKNVSQNPTQAILRDCGAMGVALWHIAVSNIDAAIPNKYCLFEEQLGLKTRQVQNVCRILVEKGWLEIVNDGGGRGNEREFRPVNPAIKGAITSENPAQMGVTDYTDDAERVHKTLHKRVQSPPIPPVCVKDVNQEDLNTHSAEAKSERPAKPLPANGLAQQIVAAYCHEAGLEQPAIYRKAVGQAAQLLKAGVTVDDVPDLYCYAVSWAGSADLGTMLTSVDRWRQKQSGKTKHANGDDKPLAYNSAKRFRTGAGGGFVG